MAFDKSYAGRSAQLNHDTITRLPATAQIRCLRDQIIVEPLIVVHSATIIVIERTKPLRGIVKAVGPGIWPRKYDRPEKHLRSKTWDSKVFRPCEVKVGDVVELGGSEIGGYAFQTFYWGDVLHLWAREEDVAVLSEDMTAEQAREEVQRVAA